MLKAKGAEVVYQNHIDAANPDLKPELLRMQSRRRPGDHAVERQCRLPVAHLQHRGAMGWDVPIVGQTTLGSGQTKALLEKPEYWNKVYSNNFRRSATPTASCRRAPRSSSTPEEGQDRVRRHAAVVGGAGLGRRA
jgi:hypothetical protein